MVKYRYAKGSDQSMIDAHVMNPEQRHDLAPYCCFGCGGELIPNLGQKRIKHFSHKSAGACSRETYLHELGKDAFLRKYTQCLKGGVPYIFRASFPAICIHYQVEMGISCKTKMMRDIDLTRHFKNIEIEKACKGFKPDILLSSDDGAEVLFIEIAVTHKCEENKIRSGNRIIEINVASEDDVLHILSGTLNESLDVVDSYNLKKKEFVGDVCKGGCEREFNLFLIYESQKSILLDLSAREVLTLMRKRKIVYHELIIFSSVNQASKAQIYKSKVRGAHFKNIPIKNCYLCKYHGVSGIGSAVFCKLRRENFDSNEASECQYYGVCRSMEECEEVDRVNEEYAKKNKSRFIMGAFTRLRY